MILCGQRGIIGRPKIAIPFLYITELQAVDMTKLLAIPALIRSKIGRKTNLFFLPSHRQVLHDQLLLNLPRVGIQQG